MKLIDEEIVKQRLLSMTVEERKAAALAFCKAIDEAAKDIVNNADEIWNNRNKP